MAQDPEAWQRLVDVYARCVYHWCRQAGLHSDDAADVVQEVFASVSKSFADFWGSPSHGHFRAWLRGITRHRVSDFFRSRHGEPHARGGTTAQQGFLEIPESLDESGAAGPQEADSVWRRGLEAVQAEFEPRTWQAFWRVAVDGETSASVAAELEMTVAAVYKAKSRVLSRLRRQLGGLEGEP